LFIFGVNATFKHDLLESLLFSLAVAVGLTPEFLPMIMSVTMSIGSIHMAKKGVIVKKLTAIPTFGSLDILCTDKTGTLTEDKIKLVRYIDVDGKESHNVLLFTYLNSYFQTGTTNPLDEAVKDFKGIKIDNFTKIDEIPFDFERRMMSVVVDEHDSRLLITKGAPEEVIKKCFSYWDNGVQMALNTADREKILIQYTLLSNEGYRVIAVAEKSLHKETKIYTVDDERDLILAGYAAFLDPKLPDSKLAIDALEDMGIEIKVLTGDNDLVTKRICSEVDVHVKGVLLGDEIEKMTDIELREKVKDTTIFARVDPNDKSRIIKALKDLGHVVGYLGDGINDALSLKTADVGISVENAVDVAKESADIILTNKSLKTLYDGVIEGRKTFGNTMKYIMMGLSSNFGNMFSVLGAVLLLPFLPMLPLQILLNNILYDAAQLTIPSDNVDSEFLKKPKRWDMKHIHNFMYIIGPISSIFDYTTFIVLYFVFHMSESGFQTG
jgi:Mg2+-importing ATPase